MGVGGHPGGIQGLVDDIVPYGDVNRGRLLEWSQTEEKGSMQRTGPRPLVQGVVGELVRDGGRDRRASHDVRLLVGGDQTASEGAWGKGVK